MILIVIIGPTQVFKKMTCGYSVFIKYLEIQDKSTVEI